MASATKETTTVITLTLTQEEADVVRTLCGNVVGCSETTQRKHADSVYNSLKNITTPLTWMIDPNTPYIRFDC